MANLLYPVHTNHLTKFQKIVIGTSLVLLTLGLLKPLLPQDYSFAAPTNVNISPTAYSVPTFINIPSLEVGLPVTELDVLPTKKRLSASTAFHLLGTGYPGQAKNIVLFADNQAFEKILGLNTNDQIVIVTKDGIGHEYLVSELLLLGSNDPRITESTPLETLTLLTPAGFLHTKRFVVKAIPSNF